MLQLNTTARTTKGNDMKRVVLFAVVLSLLSACGCSQSSKPNGPTAQERDLALRKKFNALADEWKQHCDRISMSSSEKDYLDHPSYHRLVKLGKPAVPLIMERYSSPTWEQDMWWGGHLLDDITDLQMVENRLGYNFSVIHYNYLTWWAKEKDRYMEEP
jgi:hypothetical protein